MRNDTGTNDIEIAEIKHELEQTIESYLVSCEATVACEGYEDYLKSFNEAVSTGIKKTSSFFKGVVKTTNKLATVTKSVIRLIKRLSGVMTSGLDRANKIMIASHDYVAIVLDDEIEIPLYIYDRITNERNSHYFTVDGRIDVIEAIKALNIAIEAYIDSKEMLMTFFNSGELNNGKEFLRVMNELPVLNTVIFGKVATLEDGELKLSNTGRVPGKPDEVNLTKDNIETFASELGEATSKLHSLISDIDFTNEKRLVTSTYETDTNHKVNALLLKAISFVDAEYLPLIGVGTVTIVELFRRGLTERIRSESSIDKLYDGRITNTIFRPE